MNRKRILVVGLSLLLAAGIVIAGGGGYFWKSMKIVDFQGEVKGVETNTETITVNLGTLHPGEWFTTLKGYSVNLSHNCWGRIDATIWLDNKPYGIIENLWISGNVTNRDTNTTVYYFGGDLMQRTIEIRNIPMNATINFKFFIKAGYPEDDFDLSNLHLKISIHPYIPPPPEESGLG